MQRKFISILLLAIAGPTLAAAPKPAALYSSRDDYRACLAERDQVDLARADYESQLAGLEAQQRKYRTDVRAHGTMVDGQLKINLSDAKVRVLMAHAADLNEVSEKLYAMAKDFGLRIDGYNQRCAGMVVSVPDRDAVLEERAKQGKKS